MRIANICIQNVLGISSVDIDLTAPVALFAGDNYAGKSSIREAIKAAFLGMPERVLKKKDFGQLVHEGQDAGSAAVELEGGNAVFAAPDGKQELHHNFTMSQWEPMALALPYCLDAEAFARATSDERRQLLFAITGASAKTADIVASFKTRGLDDKLIETVTPLLRSGFPAAAKYAEERCREAKGAWKAVTNETYGHVKAESWAAAVPEVDTTAIEQLKAKAEILKDKIGTEQTRLGAAEQKLKAWLAHCENQEADRKAFDRLASLETKLEHDSAELEKWVEQVKELENRAGTGPRVGLVHDLARAIYGLLVSDPRAALNPGDDENVDSANTALNAYEDQYGGVNSQGDPEAAAKLPEALKARDLMQRAVDNTKRDIDAANAAGARLQREVEKGSETELDSIRTILAGYQDELHQVHTQLQALQENLRAAQAAKLNTENARAHHQDAQQWQVAIDALSPAGIPAEILGKALTPVNEALIEIADTFGWPGVHIDSDMMITAGFRAHALLSESERWRTNTIIALALASLSGLRLVALDRVDVLNLAGRAELIDGLDALAEDNYFDTALLFGTFKKLPNFERFPQVSGFWVEDGRIAQVEAVEVAA